MVKKEKKLPYEAPDMQVTHVELESSICTGSVDFGKEEKKVEIVNQEVNQSTQNDFFTSEGAWDIENSTN